MKQVKSRYNYDPSQPLSKQYNDPEVFNAYYKCFDTQTNNHYLLSHFKTQNKTQIGSLLKKFTTIQSKMQQGMSTSHLTKIHDVFLTDKDKSLFLVIDYCEGGSIIDYIGKVYNLEPKAAVRIVLGAMNGLQELHKYDILNCFINLENIEIDQSGQSKLSFKCMIYKTIYLSPEFRKDHLKSKESDFYCLGVCLYRLIYGVFPFKAQKTQELMEMVRRGPSFTLDKQDGNFPITSPSAIRELLRCLLSRDPDERLEASQKIQQFSKSLFPTSQLPNEVYSKFFKSKYINFFTNVDETDEQEFSILDPKERKLLKLIVYKGSNNQIDNYLKTIINKFAKLSGDLFVKIYEYQIVQEEFLALVCSYCGEGNLAEYKKNLGQAFSSEMVEIVSQFMKKAIRQLDAPYKYLTNESICLKNGTLRIKFPSFSTRRFQQMIKRALSQNVHFIAPQILEGQKSEKCDSWSVGVIEYWMIYNELPRLDQKGTLVPSKKQKLSKSKLLYFYNVIEKNHDNRLNIFNDEQVKARLEQQNIGDENKNKEESGKSRIKNNQSPQNSNIKKRSSTNKAAKHDQPILGLQIRPTGGKLYGLGEDESDNTSVVKKPEKGRRSKKKDLAPIQNQKSSKQIDYEYSMGEKFKNPIVIDSKQPLQQKNPNKFNMKMFNDPEEIKTPKNIETFDKETTKEGETGVSFTEYFCGYTVKLRNKFAYLDVNYSKSIRLSLKCLIVIILYLFLFYFNFFKNSGYLMGSRQMYEAKVVHIRAFSSDSKPSINYTLVTKTPTQTYQLFYNTTVPLLRDEYQCVLNDYSVRSDVSAVIKNQTFVAYEVFGFLFAIVNILLMCIVIARYDICKVCHVTNFQERKYHTLINYTMIILAISSLTSLHYLIYGGLYHIMLEPCLGKSPLPGLEFLMKNWITSWILRFIWIFIGILFAYALIIFFLLKPLKKLNKYIYMGLIGLYLLGIGARGISKTYPAHENVFGVCGELLELLVSIFLFFTDLMFGCFIKGKTQQNMENNIDTKSIEDFNRTEQNFIPGDDIENQN